MRCIFLNELCFRKTNYLILKNMYFLNLPQIFYLATNLTDGSSYFTYIFNRWSETVYKIRKETENI